LSAFHIFAVSYFISSLIRYYVLTLSGRAGGLITLVKKLIVNSTLLHYFSRQKVIRQDMSGIDLLLR